jgi:hypothetical protein
MIACSLHPSVLPPPSRAPPPLLPAGAHPSTVAAIAALLPRPHAAPVLVPMLTVNPVATATLSPLAQSFMPTGRSKAQQWLALSPSSDASPASAQAAPYWDDLLIVATQESPWLRRSS